MSRSQAVMETILLTASWYGRNISEPLLKAYAADLADLPPHQVCAAYVRYRKNPENRTFPLPAQIRELVNPDQFVSVETKAREAAARIVGAITKFGWNNAKEAQLFIGPDGWAQVARSGGWSHLCEIAGVRTSPSTLQAQLRDQLEGHFRYGTRTIERSLEIVKRDVVAELEPAKNVLDKFTGGEGA